MAGSKTGFKIKGLKRWRQALDAGGFDSAARANIRRATALNAKVGEAIVRKTIQSGNSLKKNRKLTVSIKGANKPIVDSGLLFQAITSKVEDDFTAFVGVLRTSTRYKIVAVIHEGEEINVTPEMRGMFFMLWRVSIGELDPGKLTGRAAELYARKQKGWYPLKAETTVIVIPERPFFKVAFANTQMIKQSRDNWKKALEATFGERAKGPDK